MVAEFDIFSIHLLSVFFFFFFFFGKSRTIELRHYISANIVIIYRTLNFTDFFIDETVK